MSPAFALKPEGTEIVALSWPVAEVTLTDVTSDSAGLVESVVPGAMSASR